MKSISSCSRIGTFSFYPLLAAAALILIGAAPLPAQAQESPLVLSPADLVIEQSLEGGYDLYIRAGEGTGSVLITESTAHPDRRVASYALRNPSYHPANGNEIRILDGDVLDPAETGRFFLVDSSPEPHPELGRAFHIFIPYVVEFGYPWSRNGRLQILDGTWFNIRTFEKPYTDYEGAFVDNPFIVKVVQKPVTDAYMKETLDAYEEISEKGDGEIIYSRGEEELIGNIEKIISDTEGETLDLVLCLDTTRSMENDIPHLKTSLVPMLRRVSEGFTRLRFGLVLYKDYYEEFVVKPYPFQESFSSLERVLRSIRVSGGRDIPEAVHEALYTGIHDYPWMSGSRKIILVGDAPPHPIPRGKVDKEMVYRDAEEAGIELNVIILPQ